MRADRYAREPPCDNRRRSAGNAHGWRGALLYARRTGAIPIMPAPCTHTHTHTMRTRSGGPEHATPTPTTTTATNTIYCAPTGGVLDGPRPHSTLYVIIYTIALYEARLQDVQHVYIYIYVPCMTLVRVCTGSHACCWVHGIKKTAGSKSGEQVGCARACVCVCGGDTTSECYEECRFRFSMRILRFQ